jgi:DNA-binding XRE family transcriptional regulator
MHLPLFQQLHEVVNVQLERRTRTLSEHKNNNALAQYRRRLGLTQEQVTQLLGYRRRRAIWLFESGQCIPSLPTALKLAAIYRVPVEFLFRETFMRYRGEIREREEALHQVGQQTLFPILP